MTRTMADPTKKTDVRLGRRVLVGVVVMLAGLAWAAAAAAESGSVRYSYEQVEIGPKAQWVLVPHAEPKLKGTISASKVHGAFNLLKSDKKTSYGDSSIKVSGSVPAEATVEVKIDPDHARYKLIIMAETVYTLTEMGIDEIRFPGHAEGNVTRADIPFAAYNLTIPLWRALPPGKLVDARVRMPDGSLLEVQEVYRRWEQGDRELREALYSYLEDDISYTVVSVLKRMPKLEVDYAAQVTPLLDHDSRGVRKAALKALAEHRDDEDVLEAVVGMMENEEDAKLARRAATFLGKAGDENFSVQKQFFLLERGSDKEKVGAAEALADYDGDDRVVDKLVEALESNKAKVASTAADSLLTLSAYESLGEALGREAIAASIRMQIAEGLADSDDKSARVDGLRYMAANKEGRPGRQALRKLGKVGTEKAREAAESFLTAENRRLRMAAVDTVEGIGSLESLEAIAEAVRELDGDEKVAEAGYVILNEQPIDTILEQTNASEKVVRRLAYRAVGARASGGRASQEVVDALKKGADSSDPAIRGAAARGLGEIGGDQALEVLKTLADDSSATVRRDVAYALGNYEGGQMEETLFDYLKDDSPQVKAAALDSLEKRKESMSLKDMAASGIRKLANSERPEVRKEALEALAGLVPKDNDKEVRNVIGILSGAITSDDSDMVLRAAVRALGRFKKERAVNGIAILLNAQERELRLTALEALAETGHEAAVELVSDTLADPDPEVRRAAVLALRELKAESAKSALQQRLENEEDESIKRLIEQTIERL